MSEEISLMFKQRHNSRRLALGLIVFGAILMVFAPEVWAGVIMFGLAILIEFIGIKLEHSE